ncbi:MAG: hypothetical protein QNJ81_13345 [Acidimicrobiia bacterium]|nr:hypothetical protein [Acidimicrobiia bacterium]
MSDSLRRFGAVGGGVLLVVGSLITWISVDLGFQAFSATGIETTEGKLTLAAGIVLIGLGLVQLWRALTPRLFGYLCALTALFGAVVLLFEYLDVLERIREADGTPATASVGLGVWIAAIGALLALAAGAWTVVDERRGR